MEKLQLLVAPFTGAWIETFLKQEKYATTDVAPFTGAWIETAAAAAQLCASTVSHPSRVRGLKLQFAIGLGCCSTSHPSRVRGLKLALPQFFYEIIVVAPFTGAWIETFRSTQRSKTPQVAPFTGAWIETTWMLAVDIAVKCRTLHGCVD